MWVNIESRKRVGVAGKKLGKMNEPLLISFIVPMVTLISVAVTVEASYCSMNGQ